MNLLKLYKEIQPYRVKEDASMPWAYQFANPSGRPHHNDWVLFKKTKRIDTAYIVPLPFRKIAGNAEPIWTPMLKEYPLAPDAQVEDRVWFNGVENLTIPHVLTMHPIHKAGEWSRQAAFINGRWLECYYSRSIALFGNKFLYYYGLKLDPNGLDVLTHFPEASGSIKWGSLG